jgi:transcriptional regulator with XRE-family HTH domain
MWPRTGVVTHIARKIENVWNLTAENGRRDGRGSPWHRTLCYLWEIESMLAERLNELRETDPRSVRYFVRELLGKRYGVHAQQIKYAIRTDGSGEAREWQAKRETALRLRKEGKTLQAAAEAVGCTKQAVLQWENGGLAPSVPAKPAEAVRTIPPREMYGLVLVALRSTPAIEKRGRHSGLDEKTLERTRLAGAILKVHGENLIWKDHARRLFGDTPSTAESNTRKLVSDHKARIKLAAQDLTQAEAEALSKGNR